MQFIIRTDQPFRGHCQSVLNSDGTVAYTNGLTLEEYQREEGFPVKAISDAEFTKLLDAHENSLKSKPKRITRQRFWDMLEVLPPCRWHNAGGFEVFHVSERLTGNLVSWFAHRKDHKGDRYWEFTEDAGLPDSDLVKLLAAKV